MLPLYIFALLIHTAFSSIPCLDGVEMVSEETKNTADLIGNWTFVYHWDANIKFTQDLDDHIEFSVCPEIQFDDATPEFVEDKKAECKDFRPPFEWSDIKLRINSPYMFIKDGVIAIGKVATWLMADCGLFIQILVKKVSDDYIVLANPSLMQSTELLARQIPTEEELKCIAQNLNVGKSVHGIGTCYKL